LNKLIKSSSESVSELCFQVEKIEESFDLINAKPKPLAAYLFTKNKKLQEEFVANVPAGGMLVNDTALHVSSASPETLSNENEQLAGKAKHSVRSDGLTLLPS
jgi:hypothetical protein